MLEISIRCISASGTLDQQLLDLLVQRPIWDDAIEQTEFDSVFGGMQRSKKINLLGLPTTDIARHSGSAAPAGHDTPIGLGHAPFGLLCRNNGIAGHRYLQTFAHAH